MRCCLSVDELMIKHKGKTVFLNSICQKSETWGFKVLVCDAETGMLCKFEIYIGHTGANDEDGLTHTLLFFD